jgi:hypothetical protein
MFGMKTRKRLDNHRDLLKDFSASIQSIKDQLQRELYERKYYEAPGLGGYYNDESKIDGLRISIEKSADNILIAQKHIALILGHLGLEVVITPVVQSEVILAPVKKSKP